MPSLRNTNGHYHPAEYGIDRLSTWLENEGYPTEAIGRIREYTRREETPTGCPELDPADEEHAEHAYVEGCKAVPGVDPAWDEFCTDPSRGPVYNSMGADYALDRLNHAINLMVLPDAPKPVSGGAPTAEEAVETLRRWYRERETFREWVEREGGIAWEQS